VTTSPVFQPLPEVNAPLAAQLQDGRPAVFRGLAATWPAVEAWTFSRIAALSPELPVRLVVGNREKDPTAFTQATLGDYARALSRESRADEEQVYLKEFDLLEKFPQLAADLRQHELFPAGAITSSSAWMGPTHARTGLHYDLLDNLAVQIVGRKRFHLARPGTVERAGEMSGKYDSWARLSRCGVAELADAAAPDSDDFFAVDLEPGDVLYNPAGWWHEVVNLSAGILLSGFFGSKVHVVSRWARVRARDGLHRLGVLGRDDCTCHPRPPATPGRAPAGAPRPKFVALRAPMARTSLRWRRSNYAR